MDWIKVKTRELTQAERDNFPNANFMWDMEIPEDGDEVLVSDGKSVWTDIWGDYEPNLCGFENIDFKDGENLWWMPFPEPPELEEV